jgi:hypothetical protein
MPVKSSSASNRGSPRSPPAPSLRRHNIGRSTLIDTRHPSPCWSSNHNATYRDPRPEGIPLAWFSDLNFASGGWCLYSAGQASNLFRALRSKSVPRGSAWASNVLGRGVSRETPPQPLGNFDPKYCARWSESSRRGPPLLHDKLVALQWLGRPRADRFT